MMPFRCFGAARLALLALTAVMTLTACPSFKPHLPKPPEKPPDEPTANTAAVAIKKGIPSVIDFFGIKLAKKLVSEDKKTDLLLGNNVLAHVPDIMDFVGGMKLLLIPNKASSPSY